jgi:hypothetical protein
MVKTGLLAHGKVRREMFPGEVDAGLDYGQFLEEGFHELDPAHEARAVGDLDGQAGAGVEFQEQEIIR